jgi:tetratricopeptide (TPR) repeat protein
VRAQVSSRAGSGVRRLTLTLLLATVLGCAVTTSAHAQGGRHVSPKQAALLAEADALDAITHFFSREGAYAKAMASAERALSLREKALGPEHPDVAESLDNLAGLYDSQGAYAKAEPLYQRALSIFEKALGPEHPYVAASLNNLAALYHAQGAYAKAEPLNQRALHIREKALGPEHPYVAESLNNLAGLYDSQGAYAKAEPLFERALRILEKALGPEHPLVATSLNNLARLYQAQGAYAKAEPLLERAAAARERHLHTQLGVLPEPRKRHLLATLRSEAEGIASFHAHDAPADPAALRLALTVALQRKGRVLDEMAGARRALRRNLTPALQQELDELTSAQAALAALREAPAPRADALRALADEAERREGELSRKSVAFAAQALPVTVERVQAALPEDAALVEFVRYHRFDPKDAAGKWKEARYVAYVLEQKGPPRWVPLGEAKPIEEAVQASRHDLTERSNDANGRPIVSANDARPALRRLDALLLAPLRRVLGDAPRHLLLSPDGVLHTVPFEALVDERGHYLVERSLVTYLGSGRDLVRLRERLSPRSGPLVPPPTTARSPTPSPRCGARSPKPRQCGGSSPGRACSRAPRPRARRCSARRARASSCSRPMAFYATPTCLQSPPDARRPRRRKPSPPRARRCSGRCPRPTRARTQSVRSSAPGSPWPAPTCAQGAS